MTRLVAIAFVMVLALAFLESIPRVVLRLDSQAAWAFPINAPNARSLFGGFRLIVPDFRLTRATKLLEEGEEVADPLDQTLTVYEETITGIYGITRDLTLGLTLPIVQKAFRFTTPSGRRATIHASGVGDLSLVGIYRFYRRDVPRRSTQVSFLGGLKFPTGSGSQTDPDARLLPGSESDRIPRPLQPGSGSVDGIIGIAAFQNFDRLSFYASVQGKLNSEADGFQFGNNLHYDFTADYVFLRNRNLFLVLEFNGVFAGKSEVNGRTIQDSGGNILFISPGVEYLPLPYLILDASVQVPIVQDLNGKQLGTDFSVVVGVRYLF